ncbi:hypothetical protein V500_02299 [Pseudogymnoascus sp. VKM F-4518 (FW-2643)]|nr:hypothetical protein V500_02299 [Pseudogymnoascus sp. VKM F-4518 (FW-2643)]
MFSLALVALSFAVAAMAAPIGFGYITSSSVEDPKNAVKNMMGADVGGRSVPLNYATPHPDRDAGGGRGGRGGGRGGRGASRRDAQRGGASRGRGRGGRGGSTRDTARSANADPAPAEHDYGKYGDYGSDTPPAESSYGDYPKPPGGYGDYPPPAGGYGSYGSYLKE